MIVVNYKCWLRNLVDTSGVYGWVYLGLLSSNIATHGHIWHNAKPTQSCGMSSNIEAGSSFGQFEAVLVFRGRCFRLTCTVPVNPVSAILTRPLTKVKCNNCPCTQHGPLLGVALAKSLQHFFWPHPYPYWGCEFKYIIRLGAYLSL